MSMTVNELAEVAERRGETLRVERRPGVTKAWFE